MPAVPSSAARSQRGSTAYIPVGVDSGLRRNDDEEEKGLVTIQTARPPFLANSRLRPFLSFNDTPRP